MINYIENKKMRLRNAEALMIKLENTDISQTDLSLKSGLSRTTLWLIRKGHTLPSISTINKIEEALLK